MRSLSGLIKVIARPDSVFEIFRWLFMLATFKSLAKKLPSSSSPTLPIKPVVIPSLASPCTVFAAEPPDDWLISRPETFARTSLERFLSTNCMLPRGKPNSCKVLSLSSLIKISTRALPIPITFIFCTILNLM